MISCPDNRQAACWPGVLVLSAMTVVMGAPVLFGRGIWLLDNPAHLAEIGEMAKPGWTGWSDLAFCGYPLGQWHSPLWYGLLAWCVRLGVPLFAIYRLMSAVAFAAPSLVLYLGSRQLGPVRALWLAALLLLQPPALYGIASAWGGMWTFYLAAAAFLMLLQRWGLGRRGVLPDAALIGFIGLTHLFLFSLVPLLVLLRLLLPGPGGRPALRSQAEWLGGIGLGVLVAVAGFLPLLLAGVPGSVAPQHLSAGRLLWALVVPADLQTLTSSAPIDPSEALQWGTVPMLALLVLGVAGGIRRSPWAGMARFGLSFAAAVLAGLLLLPFLPNSVNWVWGPVTWRLLYAVRMGLACGAAGCLAPAQTRSAPLPRHWAPVAALGLILALLLAAPLRRAVRDPGDGFFTELERLWSVLAEKAPATARGRVYVQDTYRLPDLPEGLWKNSHAPAYTAAATGLPQLGAFYGMAPQRTTDWTVGEFGKLCGLYPDSPGAEERVLQRLRRAGCVLLVVFSREWMDRLRDREELSVEWQTGRTVLFRLVPPPDVPAGRLPCTWHPDWVLDPPIPGAQIVADAAGLLQVKGLSDGARPVALRFAPSRWPKRISIAAVFMLGVLLCHRLRRRC